MENNKKFTETNDRLQKDNPTLDTKNIEQGKAADLSIEVKQTPPEKADFMPGAETKTPAVTQQPEPVPQKSDSGNDEKTAVKQTPPEAEERPKANPENIAKPGHSGHQPEEMNKSEGEKNISELQKNLVAARKESAE